jgi:shikimate dehydrogenase
MSMDAPTICGSLSRYPVSLGMTMHTAGYAALGLNYVYLPFAVQDLKGALTGMRALAIRGLGISMPFKLEILELLDRLDPLAERVGAVNTVVNDAGILSGYNTDGYGALEALREQTSVEGKRGLVVGAGGAARAVAFALAECGTALHIANRTLQRAEDLCATLRSHHGEVAVTAGSLPELESLEEFDLIVQCSPVGMQEYGASSPIPLSLLSERHVVMDVVYKPIETELVQFARQRGCRTIHGGRMLLHQAARQFELYTGRSAPLQAMNRALREALSA